MKWWLRAITFCMGVLAVAAGSWVAAGAPMSKLTIDGTTGKLTLVRRGVRGSMTSSWHRDDVSAVQVIESRSDEDTPVFQIRLLFHRDRPAALSPVWSHGRERHERIAARLGVLLGVGESVRARRA
jgi:hypothetical protein